MDVLSELPEIEVCVAYELDGKRIDYFPGNISDLKRVKPIFETLPGWQIDITGITSADDLPELAIAYAARLQELIQTPIEFISVGPDRAQTIVLDLENSRLDSLPTS